MTDDSLKAQIARIVEGAIAESAAGDWEVARDEATTCILALPDLAALRAENTRLKALVDVAGFFTAAQEAMEDEDAALLHQIRESGK